MSKNVYFFRIVIQHDSYVTNIVVIINCLQNGRVICIKLVKVECALKALRQELLQDNSNAVRVTRLQLKGVVSKAERPNIPSIIEFTKIRDFRKQF